MRAVADFSADGPPAGFCMPAKLGWFALLYAAGVAVVGGVAILIRLALAH